MTRSADGIERADGASQNEKEIAERGLPDNSNDDADTETSLMPWRQKMQFYEALANNSGNRTINDDTAEDFLRALTVDPDDVVEFTYRQGNQDHWDATADFIKVAIHYVPGADLAQVNIMENSELNKDAAVHKSESWKTLTAGNLLLELEVQRDLRIIPVDLTPKVVAQYKGRQRGNKFGATVAEGIKDLAKTAENDTVNISSKNVTLLNSLSERGEYDLESTCIEVDGISLLNLIYNFRDLIGKQGQHANIAPEGTVKILEIMIEDARRLLIRSPILTRAAQRIVIQSSRNTRYGFDTGKMFHTFTTSRGIAEMIQQGVGYYSSLNQNSGEQSKIKPRFLQMVVFLLSLLNDTDLKRLESALEKSYDLKADRQSIELTVLKVLTLEAVGPYSFLTGVISAIRMQRIEITDTEEAKKKEWDYFLGYIGRCGWLLPGPGPQVGRKVGSWKVEWDKSFVCSNVFDHLQYSGEKDTVNSIPPLKVNSDALASQEVLADLSNGHTYMLTVKDLDEITMANKNRYIVTDPVTKKQSDLVVREDILFSELHTAWEDLERICSTVNDYSEVQSSPQLLRRKNSTVKNFFGSGRPRLNRPYFSVQKPLGRRTKYTTTITDDSQPLEDAIAISWKLDGRRITHNELIKGANSDITRFLHCLAQLKSFASKQAKLSTTSRDEQMTDLVTRLSRSLEKVEIALKHADEQRIEMQKTFTRVPKADEPVTRVHFPGNVHWKQELPYCKYRQGVTEDTMQLCVESEIYTVTEDPVWDSNVGTLVLGGNITATVAPFADVGTDFAVDANGDQLEGEVAKGETVLLLGHVAAVVEPQDGLYRVVTYLHLLSVNRGPAPRRRRRDVSGDGKAGSQESVLV
jgi:hypothetical protein